MSQKDEQAQGSELSEVVRRLVWIGGDTYKSDDGHSMSREYGTLTPNGNDTHGRWVLRSPNGEMLGFNKYRVDLAEQFGFTVGDA